MNPAFGLLSFFATALASAPGGNVFRVPPDLAGTPLTPFLASADGVEPGDPLSAQAGTLVVPSELQDRIRFLLSAATAEKPALLIERGARDLRLPQKDSRTVQVVNEVGGQPVAGASAVFTSEDTLRRLEGHDPGRGCSTGTDGRAAGFSWRGDRLVFVRAPGLASVLVNVADAGVVVMRRASPVAGRLVDADDRPLVSRVIKALLAVPGTTRWVAVARCRTDEAGRYRFDGVEEKARVVFDDGSSPPAFAGASAGGFATLRVPPEAVLSLRLVGAEGAPSVGTEVDVRQFSAADPETLIRRHATAAADGGAVLSGLSTILDRTIVDISAPGGVSDRRVFETPLREREDLGTVELRPVVLVKGTVKSAAGVPVAGATVVEVGFRRLLATSGVKGELQLAASVGREQPVRVEAAGFLPGSETLSSEKPFHVVLKKGARVTARLHFQDGGRPKRARLVAVDGILEGAEYPGVGDGGGPWVFDVRPGDDGLRLDAEGAEGMELGILHLSSGDSVDLGSLTLSSGGVVTGRILDADTGLPLAGATVTAQAVSENELYDLMREHLPAAVSDVTGAFRVAGIPEGEVRLFVEAAGRPVVRVDGRALTEGSDVGDVRVGMGHPLELNVIRQDRSPLANARIGLRPGGLDGTLKEVLLRTDASGRCRVERIAPGPYGLVAETSNRQHRLETLVSDSDRAIDWRIQGATVQGRVLGPDGKPMAGVRVELGVPGGSRLRMLSIEKRSEEGVPLGHELRGDIPPGDFALTDEQGRFTFQDVPEGALQLLPSDGTSVGVWQKVSVPPEGEVVQDLSFGGEAVAVAVVRDGNGEACGGWLVLAGIGGQELSRTQSQGTATFLVPPGSNARYVSASDGEGRTGIAFLSAGSRSAVVRIGAPLGDVTVVVRDSSGQPAASARVGLVRLTDSYAVSGSTDISGRWRRESIAAGRYRVFARGAGGESARAQIEIPVGPMQVPIVLQRSGSISVIVETEKGFDNRRSTVSVIDRDGSDRALDEEVFGRPAQLDAKGRYRIPSLEAGTYSVKIRLGLPDIADPEFSIDVREGRVTEKRIKAR